MIGLEPVVGAPRRSGEPPCLERVKLERWTQGNRSGALRRVNGLCAVIIPSENPEILQQHRCGMHASGGYTPHATLGACGDLGRRMPHRPRPLPFGVNGSQATAWSGSGCSMGRRRTNLRDAHTHTAGVVGRITV